MNTIATAQSEYYRRPADERMRSPEHLVEVAAARKANSREITWNAKDLTVIPQASADGSLGRVALASPRGQAELTPWSHGQLCRLVGAPASYVRTLPSDVAAAALNHGLQATGIGQKAVVLAERSGAGAVTARAITSETYGRLWDVDAYAPVVDSLCAQGWSTPPTWDGKPAGAYLSDRDSFLVLTHGGSIVNDPSASQGGQLYRGLMLRNSEVGLTSYWLDEVLYRYICGNHMFWGAVFGTQYKRRHVGSNVLRDVLREIGAMARRLATRPASADEALIRSLINLELASTKEGLIDELRKMGATVADAELAYTTAVEAEDLNPRSYWGIAQGMTRASQASGYQDDRLELDQLAARVLAKGRTLVAA